ncbi:probable serine/threonine-protein kinase clkA [Ctenocephalides felis]|uniref:probable serine/threonine-protein kinase clkA n=1 Tax=Ctenocephalides felis TaxID=7515 RepID=UPI000E6E3710|nr:probable serine/threonine-protein kinase clkA [Ctenocephalides felis]
MTDFIKCIICDKRANSMSEMHLHQTTCHSIDQFSLIILSRRESKIENAIDKVLQSSNKTEGRRKKNPRPRKNDKTETAKKQYANEIADGVQNIGPEKEVDETKPIQQPELSTTINTPLKRSLGKKPTKPANVKISKASETTKTPTDVIRKRTTVSSTNRREKVSRCSQNKKCAILESVLVAKGSVRKRNQINVINPTKMKLIFPQANNQEVKAKEDVTWNKAYQNYVDGLQVVKEIPVVQADYTSNNALNFQNILTKQNQNQTPFTDKNEGYEFNNNNHQQSSEGRIQNPYHLQDNLGNDLLNKTFIESNDLISDLRNIAPEHLVNNLNDDSNLDSISMGLTNDVKDFIVEFFEEEQNAETRNPYWEDNMNKYFPSETKSSSEIEQFNENADKYMNGNDEMPLNLVIREIDVPINQESFNNIFYHTTYTSNSANKAICKSTWSEEYMNSQNANFWASYNVNKRPYEFSGINDNQRVKTSEEKMLEEHFQKTFIGGEPGMMVYNSEIQENNMNLTHFKYECHAYDSGFGGHGGGGGGGSDNRRGGGGGFSNYSETRNSTKSNTYSSYQSTSGAYSSGSSSRVTNDNRDNSFFPNKSDDKTRSHGGETDFNVNDDFDCMITDMDWDDNFNENGIVDSSIQQNDNSNSNYSSTKFTRNYKSLRAQTENKDFSTNQKQTYGGNSSGWHQTKHSNRKQNDEKEVLCSGCQEPARKQTVKKEGPNKGRKFYVCPKPMEQQCKFFEWAEDEPEHDSNESTNNWSSKPSKSRKTSTTVSKRKTTSKATGTKPTSKRKCGQCRQEGHTIKNCPNISHV